VASREGKGQVLSQVGGPISGGVQLGATRFEGKETIRKYATTMNDESLNRLLPKNLRPADSGKNDLTRRVTHREAVFGTVIHSIFDAWHYEVLWTCD